jgi:hypothetical protein
LGKQKELQSHHETWVFCTHYSFPVQTNHFSDVKDFVAARRFETFSLHNILQGFSISDCDWLAPPGAGAKQQHRVSVSDALKRKELLEEFLFWFFDSFVGPLIKVLSQITASDQVFLTYYVDLLLCDRVLCFSQPSPLFQTG